MFVTRSVNVNRSTKTLSLLFKSAVESILTNNENFLKFPVFLVISSRSGWCCSSVVVGLYMLSDRASRALIEE